MKRNKEILTRMIFLLVVFISIRTIAPSEFNPDSLSVELLCVTFESGESFYSDNDSVIEDIIEQADRNILTVQCSDNLSALHNFSLVHTFTHSIWQPPKIC